MKHIKRTIFQAFSSAFSKLCCQNHVYWVINSLPPVCSHAIRTTLMVWVRITLGFQPRVIRTQTINIFSYCMNKQGITNSIISVSTTVEVTKYCIAIKSSDSNFAIHFLDLDKKHKPDIRRFFFLTITRLATHTMIISSMSAPTAEMTMIATAFRCLWPVSQKKDCAWCVTCLTSCCRCRRTFFKGYMESTIKFENKI